MIRIGVIGYGYWGPNVVRNLRSLEGCDLAAVCDRSPAALQRVAQAYPDLTVTADPTDLMLSPKIDAIAVVTPVCTHFELAKAALQNGKHVFIEKKPEAVTATGQAHLNGLVDVAFITIYFPNKTIAHINVNWLSPVKIRTTLIGGEKKMLVWNDVEADEKIKIYDKGVQMNNGREIYELLVSYRSGDMWAPRVEQTEALKVELNYFVDCVGRNETPVNDGVAGSRVVRLLEAADRSLRERGRAIEL